MRRLVFIGSTVLLGVLLILALATVVPDTSEQPLGQQTEFKTDANGRDSGDDGIANLHTGTAIEVKTAAEKAPGVKSAWPVLSGNDVTIGIEKTATADDSVTAAVAQQVKSDVDWIDEVTVAVDSASVQRLRILWQAQP
ncbi:MAG: YhcN/YlaJ family sporulation lipoprotein [Kiritimatiellia bacterium]